jgi:Uma2 family endonuclease
LSSSTGVCGSAGLPPRFIADQLTVAAGADPDPGPHRDKPVDIDGSVIEAAAAALVCEIVLPNTAATDRVLKMHYYAEAGIEWYLLVEPDSPALSLYRLEGEKYVEQATARPGVPLRMDAPVAVELDPDELLSDD